MSREDVDAYSSTEEVKRPSGIALDATAEKTLDPEIRASLARVSEQWDSIANEVDEMRQFREKYTDLVRPNLTKFIVDVVKSNIPDFPVENLDTVIEFSIKTAAVDHIHRDELPGAFFMICVGYVIAFQIGIMGSAKKFAEQVVAYGNTQDIYTKFTANLREFSFIARSYGENLFDMTPKDFKSFFVDFAVALGELKSKNGRLYDRLCSELRNDPGVKTCLRVRTEVM